MGYPLAGDEVLVLNYRNFKEAVLANEHLFVFFFRKWEAWLDVVLSEFAASSSIRVAKCDPGTTEGFNVFDYDCVFFR